MSDKEISFKALNTGVGFFQDLPPSSSYYDLNDEDRLLSSSSVDLFHSLEQSPQFYDQLMERLERPILDSFEKNRYQKPIESTVLKESMFRDMEKISDEKKNEAKIFCEEETPLNRMCLPSLSVMKVDFAFTFGLYTMGWALVGVLFSIQVIPSVFFGLMGFGLFHQIYTVICRSIIGSTLGEERYNLSWNQHSVIRFALRSFIIVLTGFVFIPILSALFGRNLLEDYTHLRLEYNI